MKTPSGTYFEVSELKRRLFVVVGPNFVSPSLNGGGGLNFNPAGLEFPVKNCGCNSYLHFQLGRCVQTILYPFLDVKKIRHLQVNSNAEVTSRTNMQKKLIQL